MGPKVFAISSLSTDGAVPLTNNSVVTSSERNDMDEMELDSVGLLR